MNKEIQYWVGRWKKLNPSPQRDMVIKMWSQTLKTKQRYQSLHL